MTMLKQHLFRHQGHIGAYLVVAGVDPTGVHLFTVHAHGSTDKLPYVTMGSGSLAAMAVFETYWKKDMTRQEAIDLCSEAIKAGIFNDLGSGSNVDVCVIDENKVSFTRQRIYTHELTFLLSQATLMRNHIKPNEREPKERSYRFPRGTTAYLKQQVVERKDLKKYVTIVDLGATATASSDAMEVDA